MIWKVLRNLATTVLAITIITGVTSFALGQSKPIDEPTREQLQVQISILQDYIKKHQAGAASPDPSLVKAYAEAKKREYEYIAQVMDVNISAFRAQAVASNIILCLVALVVVAGISFAGFQLWKSTSIAGVQTDSNVEISASNVRVTSSVVGVVVLTISLVFLYIYTKEVYHVRLVSSGAEPAAKTPQ